jgi:hypothetical protein
MKRNMQRLNGRRENVTLLSDQKTSAQSRQSWRGHAGLSVLTIYQRIDWDELPNVWACLAICPILLGVLYAHLSVFQLDHLDWGALAHYPGKRDYSSQYPPYWGKLFFEKGSWGPVPTPLAESLSASDDLCNLVVYPTQCGKVSQLSCSHDPSNGIWPVSVFVTASYHMPHSVTHKLWCHTLVD